MSTHYALVPNIWKYSHYGRGLLFVFADAYILDMWDCQLILQFIIIAYEWALIFWICILSLPRWNKVSGSYDKCHHYHSITAYLYLLNEKRGNVWACPTKFWSSFLFKLYMHLLACRIIWGFARLWGNGLRSRQTPTGYRCQAGVHCMCVSFKCVCVSVSNGAINWPPRSIMHVPGLAPLGPQYTCALWFK